MFICCAFSYRQSHFPAGRVGIAVTFRAAGNLSPPIPVRLSMKLPNRYSFAPLTHREDNWDTENTSLVSANHYAPTWAKREPRFVAGDAKHHPQNFGYAFPALTRLRAHLLEKPRRALASWSAATLFGFGVSADGFDTYLFGRRTSPPTHPLAPHVIRLRDDPMLHLRWVGLLIDTVDPAFALVRCLQDVLSCAVTWRVSPVPGLSDHHHRAIQLIDAYLNANHDLAAFLSAADRKISKRVLAKIMPLTSPGAESPKETSLRLLLGLVCGLELETQVEIWDGTTLVTRADLADKQRKFAFFYDGGHHGEHMHWLRDGRITFHLESLGWKVIRVTYPLMDDPEVFLQRLLAQI